MVVVLALCLHHFPLPAPRDTQFTSCEDEQNWATDRTMCAVAWWSEYSCTFFRLKIHFLCLKIQFLCLEIQLIHLKIHLSHPEIHFHLAHFITGAFTHTSSRWNRQRWLITIRPTTFTTGKTWLPLLLLLPLARYVTRKCTAGTNTDKNIKYKSQKSGRTRHKKLFCGSCYVALLSPLPALQPILYCSIAVKEAALLHCAGLDHWSAMLEEHLCSTVLCWWWWSNTGGDGGGRRGGLGAKWGNHWRGNL